MKYLFGWFERSVGAAADVKELEYISALHQTATEIDEKGVVTAADVRIFLRSRFGIDIDKEDSIDIVRGLSGQSRLPLPRNDKSAFSASSDSDQPGKRTLPLHFLRRRRRPSIEGKTLSEISDSSHSNQLRTKSASKCDDHDSVRHEEHEHAEDRRHHFNILRKTGMDFRTSWFFPGEGPKRRKITNEVEKSVHYDLSQMLSVLLIPTLVRVHRFRFSKPPGEPEARSRRQERNNVWTEVWALAGLASRFVAVPLLWWRSWLRKRHEVMKEDLRPRPNQIVEDVLRIMLGALEDEEDTPSSARLNRPDTVSATTDGTAGSYFPALKETYVSDTLIRRILRRFGNAKASNDDRLVKDMVEAAGGEGALFNEKTLAMALTADVERWPVECEDDVSTSFFDVYGFDSVECNERRKTTTPEELLSRETDNAEKSRWLPTTRSIRVMDGSRFDDGADSFHSAESKEIQSGSSSDSIDEARNETRGMKLGKIPQHRVTGSAIDYAMDGFRSVLLVVYIFLFYLVAAFFVIRLLATYGFDTYDGCCELSFVSKFVGTLWNWVAVATTLVVSGFVITVPLSFGNSQYTTSWGPPATAMLILLVYILLPPLYLFLVDYLGLLGIDGLPLNTESFHLRLLYINYVVVGILAQIELLRGLVSSFLPKELIRRFYLFRFLFVPSNIRRVAQQKRSGTRKINQMIQHAHKLHRKAHKHGNASNREQATILNFILYGEKKVECGGFLWTWKQVLNGNLFHHEGIWIHARLVVGQVGQIGAWIFLLVVILWGTEYTKNQVAEVRKTAKEQPVFSEWLLFYVPTPAVIHWSFYPGGVLTLLMVSLLITVYFPNTCSLILKFRSGFFPSLKDPRFQKFRNTSYVYYNLGNMYYALMGSAGLFFFIFTGLLFMTLWKPTAEFMLVVISWGVGLSITVGARMLITMCCTASTNMALYRKRPLRSNLAMLAMECWNLGLGGGVLVGRLTQFLLAAAFWVGRVDSQFLSDEVEVFGYRFDTVPQKYVCEVLAHEAHRHPLLERMAALYLMRLKYGEYFSTDAGATWRTVFVLVLWPWMLKYREGTDDDEDEVDDPVPSIDQEPFRAEDWPDENDRKTEVQFEGIEMPEEENDTRGPSQKLAEAGQGSLEEVV